MVVVRSKSLAQQAQCPVPSFRPPATDLSLIRRRVLETQTPPRYYRSLEHFLQDVGLVFSNCRAYNKPDTEYVACANKLQAFVTARVRAMQAAAAAGAAPQPA